MKTAELAFTALNAAFQYSSRERMAPTDPSPDVADPARVAAVRALGLLDTPPEEVFDRMTRLAASIIGVPASFISLIDADRDFYKSHAGMPDPLATERELRGRTLCHYTLRSGAPLALDDVADMPEFRDVPTVKSLGVRAYLGVPLRTAGGHNIGSFCAIDVAPRHWSERDISVLTELAHSAMREVELRLALRARAAADRRKDAFVATLAHELRQPLAALMPALGLLEARISEASMQRARDVIARQAKQIQRLVNDLMDAASVAAGKIVLHREDTDLALLLVGAADSVRPLAAQRRQTLRVAAPDGPVWIAADGVRLHQVFSNLITNAIKYTQPDGEIDVTLMSTPESVTVTVRDNGRGISPEALPDIFELFMQEDVEPHAGLGIGLNVVRGLVNLHGGTVEARSGGSGRGSEFIVSLPRRV